MLQVHSEQRRGAGLGRGDQAAGRHGGGGALTSLTPVQYSAVQYCAVQCSKVQYDLVQEGL